MRLGAPHKTDQKQQQIPPHASRAFGMTAREWLAFLGDEEEGLAEAEGLF